MAQCLHLDTRGRRCGQPAEEELPFCPAHGELSAARVEQAVVLRRQVLRLAALLLLAVFLLPLAVQGYRMLRSLLN